MLNETEASGCGQLSVSCLSQSLGSFSLGCFSDSNVVPRCFGGCNNSCSFHGVCKNGVCDCDTGYEGTSDCSKSKILKDFWNSKFCTGGPPQVCPNDCGGSARGTCVSNKCECNDEFSGDDCSEYIGSWQNLI